MCNFSANCKNEAKYTVIHKAVAAMPERQVNACPKCASMIGKRSPQGPVINTAGRENAFYKIVQL